MVLRLRKAAPGQWDDAKCRIIRVTEDYDPFFEDEHMDDALDFCNGLHDDTVCPIRHKCLLFALSNNEKFGVWGGMSELGRKAIRKKMPARGGKPNYDWQWMNEETALSGLDADRLRRELDEEKNYQD